MKMKNLKKLFSLALASAMALNLFTMTAFATEGDTSQNSTPAEATVVENIPVTKYVKVTKGAAIPEQKFTFKMTPVSAETINGAEDENGIKIYPGVSLGTADTVEYDFSSSDTEKAVDGKVTQSGGSFDLTGVTFTHTGIYRYSITEDAAENPQPYITYSNEKYTVDLYVLAGDKDAEGKTTYVPQGVTVTKDGVSNTTFKPQDITFTNTINDNLLTISKTVEGEEYTKDELFDFYIKIPKGGDTIQLDGGTKLYAKILNGTEQVTDKDRTNSDGLVELTVNGDNNADNVQTEGTHFQLKAGETLQISAPITMVYYVQEADYSDEDYTQYFTYNEEGKKTDSKTLGAVYNTGDRVSCFDDSNNLKVVKGTINTATNEVSFINVRNFTAPSTGINLAMLPYALITLCAVCGGILFISRKRRVDR
jgi:hypothetical protein